MGVPEADDHRRSLPGDPAREPSQDTELGHGTRQQPLLDQGASHGSPGPTLNQGQPWGNSRSLKGNYLCKTPVQNVASPGSKDGVSVLAPGLVAFWRAGGGRCTAPAPRSPEA